MKKIILLALFACVSLCNAQTPTYINGAVIPANLACVGTNAASQLVLGAGCGGSGGGISGPGTTTTGFVPVWNSSTGASLANGLQPTGTGPKLASSTGSPTSGNCAQWLTGNIVDSGAPCGTGSGVAWGSITGTLSSQTDLQTALNAKQAAGNYIVGLTGDVIASGPGSVAATLATVNSNVGSFGSSTNCITITVNAKGLITAASQMACAGGGGSTATAITSGTLSGLPGACSVGAVYFATDQPAGQQLYQCSATNAWTQTLNLGGSGNLAFTGGALDTTSNVANLASAQTFSAAKSEGLAAKWGCTHGTNATCGVVVLVAGTATVSTTAIAALATTAAGDVVTLNYQNCLSCGSPSVGTVTAGTSFVVNSTSGTDTSSIYWEIKHIL